MCHIWLGNAWQSWTKDKNNSFLRQIVHRPSSDIHPHPSYWAQMHTCLWLRQQCTPFYLLLWLNGPAFYIKEPQEHTPDPQSSCSVVFFPYPFIFVKKEIRQNEMGQGSRPVCLSVCCTDPKPAGSSSQVPVAAAIKWRNHVLHRFPAVRQDPKACHQRERGSRLKWNKKGEKWVGNETKRVKERENWRSCWQTFQQLRWLYYRQIKHTVIWNANKMPHYYMSFDYQTKSS